MTRISRISSHHPFSSRGTGPDLSSEDADRPDQSGHGETWCKLPTAHAGARLYRVEPAAEVPVYWIAEMTIDDRTHRRRCASELYARWWLNALLEPARSPDPVLHAQFEEPQREALD